jgi:hypothetical protein
MNLDRITYHDEDGKPHLAGIMQVLAAERGVQWIKVAVPMSDPPPPGKTAALTGARLYPELEPIADMMDQTDMIMEEAMREEDDLVLPLDPDSTVKEWPELRHLLAHMWGAIEALAESRPGAAMDDLDSIASQVFWPADESEQEEEVMGTRKKKRPRPKKNPCKGR